LTLVSIGDDEFHTVIDAPHTTKRPGGKLGKLASCVRESVEAIAQELRGKVDYEPTFLTDNTMGIKKFSRVVGGRFLSPVNRAKYQGRFRKELAFGVKGLKIHVFGKVNSDNEPDCIFVLKVPKVSGKRLEGNVAKAIHNCKEMMPEQVSQGQ